MKKFRGFTLIESLVVIFIIGIISTAIYNMRNLGQNNIDYRKEAVNVMYKEISEMLKDFQRNKIWKDPQGNEHEIDTFQIKMVGSGDEEAGRLEIGYTYLYCIENENLEDEAIVQCYDSNGNMTTGSLVGSGYYESKTLISSEKNYTAQKNIKNIDKYLFKASGETTIINIYKDGTFEMGYDYLDNFQQTIADIYTIEQGIIEEQGGGYGVFDDAACAAARNQCIDSLCPNYNNHHRYRRYNKEHCKRSKMKGITPQSMAVLQTRRHHGWRGFREERQAYRGVGGVGTRKKMDGCLQQNKYNDKGCSASQRRTRDDTLNNGTEIINYTDFSPEASEITNFFSFFVYAAEKNGKQCNTEGAGGKTWRPIGKITVNTITKTAIIERCNNDRTTNGIDCGLSTCE